MSRSEHIFILILIINTAIAVLYLLFGLIFHRKNERGENQRLSWVIKAFCMAICPVAGPLFFLVSMLIRVIFFRSTVDLGDVMFSKKRVESHVSADVERETNLVPIEEALTVSDQSQLRQLMLNVIKGDIDDSLASVALALNSEDSETSHYAASVLSKALNDFRMNVRKLGQEIEKEPENWQELCVLLLEYMNRVLAQRVFTEVEQLYFVGVMADAGEKLYRGEVEERAAKEQERLKAAGEEESRDPLKEENWEEYGEEDWEDETEEEEASEEEKNSLTAGHIAWIAQRLMEIKHYEESKVWCGRAMELFPDQVDSFRCWMRYYFEMNDQKHFLETLDQLKKSKVIVDSEMLEMIRMFS
ncbi:MAG: hypothetical protein LUE16_00265 [Lachnospiraceae bacterium]|nr:hypothetical protein [Lachnospiraceae bacterium]